MQCVHVAVDTIVHVLSGSFFVLAHIRQQPMKKDSKTANYLGILRQLDPPIYSQKDKKKQKNNCFFYSCQATILLLRAEMLCACVVVCARISFVCAQILFAPTQGFLTVIFLHRQWLFQAFAKPWGRPVVACEKCPILMQNSWKCN